MSYAPITPTATIQSESSLLLREKWEDKSPPVSEAGKRVTLQEYWDFYYEHEHFAYEWNNGILEEKPMTDYDSLEQYYWFLDLLRAYLRSHPIAALTGLELGMKLSDSVRKPDIGVVLKNDTAPFQSGDNKCKGACDLSIESLSVSGSAAIKRDTKTKKKEYEKNGVTEYFILDHRHKETAFYRLNPKTKRYNKIPLKQKEIVESEVLPGFCFRLSDLKTMRPLKSLMTDPVYSSYVFPEYQAKEQERKKEQLRAEQATLRAEQATLKAEQERKEKEEERLRAEQATLKAERATLKAEQERKEKEEERLRAEQATKRAEQAEKEKEALIKLLKEQGVTPENLF